MRPPAIFPSPFGPLPSVHPFSVRELLVLGNSAAVLVWNIMCTRKYHMQEDEQRAYDLPGLVTVGTP